MRHANWHNEEYMKAKRAEVARVAHDLREGRLDVVHGARKLDRLRHEVTDTDLDDDFVLFTAIASESDHLPVDEVRKQWSSTALDKADAEIKKMDSLYRARVIEACDKLLTRFGSRQSTESAR